MPITETLIFTMATFLISDPGIEQAKAAPQSGYHCLYEDRGSFGLISGMFDVTTTGEVIGGEVLWEGAGTSIEAPRIGGEWFMRVDHQFSIEDGTVNFFWHIWDSDHRSRRRSLTLSLELTTVIESTTRSSRIASGLERSGGPFYLIVASSDAFAMARGAEKLFIVARNKKYKIVKQSQIDPGLFEPIEQRIKLAFDRVQSMIADPSKYCTFTNDVDDEHVVVT